MGQNYTITPSLSGSWMDNPGATHQDFPNVTAPLPLASFLAQLKVEWLRSEIPPFLLPSTPWIPLSSPLSILVLHAQTDMQTVLLTPSSIKAVWQGARSSLHLYLIPAAWKVQRWLPSLKSLQSCQQVYSLQLWFRGGHVLPAAALKATWGLRKSNSTVNTNHLAHAMGQILYREREHCYCSTSF